MKRHLKRLAALLMTAVLTASMLSSGAMAAETSEAAEVVSEEEISEEDSEETEILTEEGTSGDETEAGETSEETEGEETATDEVEDAADTTEDLEDDAADSAYGTEASVEVSEEETVEETGTDESGIAAVSTETGEEISEVAGEEAAEVEESSEEIAAEEAAAAEGDTSTAASYSVNVDDKTITVTSTSEDDYTQNTGIQDAINYIYETYASSIKCDQNAKESELAKYEKDQINTLNGGEDGWTIVVESGTYNRFTVLSYLDYLTIEAADDADVTIMVLDESDAPVATSGGWLDTAGVCVRNASYVTLDGFTFEAYSYQSTPWYAAAVSSHNEVGYYAYGMTVTNCTFNGTGGSYGTGNYAVLATSIGCFYVKGCTFDSWYAAVCWMTDNYAVSEVVINGNTFTNCDRACDGYFGNGNNTLTEDKMGTFQFTNNTVTGTYDLYSKVLIADQYATTSSANHDATGKVTLSGNTLEYAEFLLLDLDTNLEAAGCDVTKDNTFGDNAFVVQGSEATAVFNVVFAFEADSDQAGYWEMLDSSELESLAIVGVGWTEEEAEIIVAAMEAANASGSHTLTLDFFSIYEEGTENYTSYWAWTVVRMKYGVRWVGSEGDDPTVEKAVTSDSTMEAGDTAGFSLTVSAPEYLDIYFEDNIEEEVTEEGSYIVTVHDVMDSVLELDEGSIAVTVDGNVLDTYRYALVTSDLEDECTFEITIDLVTLVEAGILTADEDGDYQDIVITYSATVADDADAGSYNNTTWVTYGIDGESEPSTVTVTIPEPEVEEEEETTTTTTTEKKSKSYSSSGSSSTTTTTSAQTGDSTKVTLWLVLAATAAIGVAGAGVYGWRRKRG